MAQEEEEDQGRTRKRKQSGQCPAQGGKQGMKEREQNERKVVQLAEENERLKREIERLTREVEATRRALIDRMVNLHQA